VDILNESTFKKLIFWLICPLLVVFSIGNAAALYSVTGSQEATISATNGVISSATITDSQTAEASGGSGVPALSEQVTGRTLITPGAVVIRQVATQTQSVVNPSTDDTAGERYSGSTPTHQFDTINTDGTDSITLSQTPEEYSEENENIYQEQRTSLIAISTPSGRVTGVIQQRER